MHHTPHSRHHLIPTRREQAWLEQASCLPKQSKAAEQDVGVRRSVSVTALVFRHGVLPLVLPPPVLPGARLAPVRFPRRSWPLTGFPLWTAPTAEHTGHSGTQAGAGVTLPTLPQPRPRWRSEDTLPARRCTRGYRHRVLAGASVCSVPPASLTDALWENLPQNLRVSTACRSQRFPVT